MTSTAASSGITSQIWQRLVRQGDTNADNSLSKDEFEALRAGFQGNADIEEIIGSLDANGDGSLSLPELPSSPLDGGMLGPMLDFQEYSKADATTRDQDDKRVVSSLFERADVDRDGFLSKEEMEAESTLRQTRWLEGKATDSDPVYLIRQGADRDHLSPKDLLVGRRIPLDQLKVVPPEQLPADVREALEKAGEELKSAPDYKPPLTEEEQRQQATDRVINAPLTATYVSRLLSQLSITVAKTDPASALRGGVDGVVA